MSQTQKILQKRLRDYRKLKGFTQESLAEKAGMGYKYYQHLETGKEINPTLKTLEAICKVLRIEIANLFDPSEKLFPIPFPYKPKQSSDPIAAEGESNPKKK